VGVERLRAGERLAAGGGLALLVSLFLPWYGVGGADVSGFEAFSVIDLLLALLALLAIALAVLQVVQDGPTLPVGAAVLAATLGKLGVVLVLFRIVVEPGSSVLEVQVGAWFALAAAVAITAGGWLSLADEHVRGLPPDVEPDLRPTPAP
jgi:hypothetical protein